MKISAVNHAKKKLSSLNKHFIIEKVEQFNFMTKVMSTRKAFDDTRSKPQEKFIRQPLEKYFLLC